MRSEGIVDTVKSSAIVLNTFPPIPFNIVIFGKDLEGVFLDFPFVYKSLVEGREIIYAVGS